MELEPYPYDKLDKLKALALEKFGSVIDLSIGTPKDKPPQFIYDNLDIASLDINSYPTVKDSLELHEVIANWLKARFNLNVDLDQIGLCVGTKEFVASLPLYLRNVRGSSLKDLVIYPEPSYPTYKVGAQIAGQRFVPILEREGTLDFSSLKDISWEEVNLVWINSPANPTGRVIDISKVADFFESKGAFLISDECYIDFDYTGRAMPLIALGTTGRLSLFSLSKRSNLAGVRVGFYVGDPCLVRQLREIRRHAGLMVPKVSLAIAKKVLKDEAHVLSQKNAYLERLKLMKLAFNSLGLDVNLPEGTFYLWIEIGDFMKNLTYEDEKDLSMAFVSWLGKNSGIIVSPGSFYGESGSNFVRVAVVEPIEILKEAAERIKGIEL